MSPIKLDDDCEGGLPYHFALEEVEPYSPSTPIPTLPPLLPHLPPWQSSLHTQSPDLWKQLEDQGCGPGESVDHVILRFLRARKFKVGEALAMLREDLEWR